MTNAAAVNPPPDPFRSLGEALLRTPDDSVAGVLSGRFALGAQQRAEPEDVFASLVAHPLWEEQRASLTDNLDRALLAWLKVRVAWSVEHIVEHGVRAYVAELSDGLAIAARLPLHHLARELGENQPAWDNRLSALRWPGDLDLLRQLDMVLICHQTDTRFAPRWFAACDRAAWGGPQWRTDLATGLLGLRKLPHQPTSRPEYPVAAALARFAVTASGRGLSEDRIKKAFQRGAAHLRALYPRHDEHWHSLWGEVLKDFPTSQHEAVETIRDRWLPSVLPPPVEVAPARRRGRTSSNARTSKPAKLPSYEESQPLLADLKMGHLDTAVWSRMQRLMRRHFDFASWSGNPYHAVRALSNAAFRLLRLGPDNGQLQELHAWTLRAIELEPDNGYLWGLWARILTEFGQPGTALAVRWETIRRFPKNPVLRTELATELHSRGQSAIAEDLLCQTMRDFPRNEYCRTLLAKLLHDDKGKRAEHLLRKSIDDFPSNEFFPNLLAKILLNDNERVEEAKRLLRKTARDFARDVVSRHTLALLLWRKENSEAEKAEAEKLYAEAQNLEPNNPYIQKLGKLIRGEEEYPEEYDGEHILPMPFYLQARPQTDQEEAGWQEAHRSEPLEDTAVEPTEKQPAVEPEGTKRPKGAETEEVPSEADSEVRPSLPAATPIEMAEPFLEQLRARQPLIEAYFKEANGGADSRQDRAGIETSALTLVAAFRAGAIKGREGKELLDNWIRIHPASYSVRLLQAWKGPGDDPLDTQALKDIADQFPEQRAWTDWLRLRELPESRRSELLNQLCHSQNKHDRDFWDERIEAVYQGLDFEADSVGLESSALASLLQDIAFAEADRAVPSVVLR